MTPQEFAALVRMLSKLGEEVELDKEEMEAYYPELTSISDFYIPRPRSYNWENIRKLTTPRGLR